MRAMVVGTGDYKEFRNKQLTSGYAIGYGEINEGGQCSGVRCTGTMGMNLVEHAYRSGGTDQTNHQVTESEDREPRHACRRSPSWWLRIGRRTMEGRTSSRSDQSDR